MSFLSTLFYSRDGKSLVGDWESNRFKDLKTWEVSFPLVRMIGTDQLWYSVSREGHSPSTQRDFVK